MSNNPEEINSPGIVFKEKIATDESVRFLYYHKAEKKKLFLFLTVANEQNKPGKLFISKSSGGPDTDSLFAGHVATRRYFKIRKNQEGILITLDPGETVDVFKQLIKPYQTVSGFFSLHNMGEELTIKMVAICQELGSEGSFFQQQKVSEQCRGGVFNTAKFDLNYTFNKYQTDKIFRIGDGPKIFDIYTGKYLKGNYGVMYNINLFLDNRYNNESRNIELLLITGGGMARGNFQIQDRIYETELLKSREEESLIKKIELFPNEFRRITIKTMPQPGSFYPVNLLVREAK
ncbi:MAG: hypothetical protein ABIH39_02215 [Candidatus Margulisiibacteriota bacterium]